METLKPNAINLINQNNNNNESDLKSIQIGKRNFIFGKMKQKIEREKLDQMRLIMQIK